jgi:hypothetical protein
MSDTKISALTSATTPLAGTEVLPIVQSSTTVKVAVNDLTVRNIRAAATTGILQVSGPTAGTTRTVTVPDANFTAARTDAAQSFTGDQTLSTGNLIQGTAAKGFNFTANTAAAGMTSQLLNWYEEGTWTPTNIGGALVVVGTFSSSGVYTRIGRQVTVQGTLNGTTSVAITGGANVVCAGLPFACRAALFPGTAVNGAATASAVLYANANTNVGSVTALAASSSIYFSITYFV